MRFWSVSFFWVKTDREYVFRDCVPCSLWRTRRVSTRNVPPRCHSDPLGRSGVGLFVSPRDSRVRRDSPLRRWGTSRFHYTSCSVLPLLVSESGLGTLTVKWIMKECAVRCVPLWHSFRVSSGQTTKGCDRTGPSWPRYKTSMWRRSSTKGSWLRGFSYFPLLTKRTE